MSLFAINTTGTAFLVSSHTVMVTIDAIATLRHVRRTITMERLAGFTFPDAIKSITLRITTNRRGVRTIGRNHRAGATLLNTEEITLFDTLATLRLVRRTIQGNIPAGFTFRKTVKTITRRLATNRFVHRTVRRNHRTGSTLLNAEEMTVFLITALGFIVRTLLVLRRFTVTVNTEPVTTFLIQFTARDANRKTKTSRSLSAITDLTQSWLKIRLQEER